MKFTLYFGVNPYKTMRAILERKVKFAKFSFMVLGPVFLQKNLPVIIIWMNGATACSDITEG